MPMTADEQLMAMGCCGAAFLLALWGMDRWKKARTGQIATADARRVQQDRGANLDGSKRTTAENTNNSGAYRAVSYEHNNPVRTAGRSGPSGMSMASTPQMV
jgi:hypothetical protein